MRDNTKDSFKFAWSNKYGLLFGGIGVGIFAGFLVSIFRVSLREGEHIRRFLMIYGTEALTNLFMIMGLFILAYLIVYIAFKSEPLCRGSGIPQIQGELAGQIEQRWWQIILAKFIGGFFALSSGLSLGREGPSVQLGAMAGKGFAKANKCIATEEKMFITCGAAAGLSTAFCAPLSGAIFALEELHKNFSTIVLVTAMASSITANFIATYVFSLEPVFQLPETSFFPLKHYWSILVLGALLGIFGTFYNKITDKCQDLYAKLPNKFIRTAVPFIFCAIFVYLLPKVLGGGHVLVEDVILNYYAIGFLIVLFICKFAFSIICSSSGVPGGIFLPLLVLGGLIGALYSEILVNAGFPSMYKANFVILGMAGSFTAIVRSPVTGIILITEMTGDFTNFMPLAIVALASLVVSDMLKAQPIYEQLLERMLKGKDSSEEPSAYKRKLLIDSRVHIGSLMDGEEISKMLLPKGALVVSVQRGEREVVPNGKTVLRGGDKLVIICSEAQTGIVKDKLSKICESIIS